MRDAKKMKYSESAHGLSEFSKCRIPRYLPIHCPCTFTLCQNRTTVNGLWMRDGHLPQTSALQARHSLHCWGPLECTFKNSSASGNAP